jgi:metal-responsive CopG/Arc/MetJ family transcriptional regulator
MARKSEIKVYLPERLVGELEGRKRMGTRSKFIEKAIQSYLRKHEGLNLDEINTIVMLCQCRDRLSSNRLVHDLLQLVINEVNKL